MLLEDWFYSGIRISLPLLFAAYGGLFCERSGIANIALEAHLLFSSFTAAAVTSLTHNIFLGVSCGILASVLVGCVLGFFSIKARADQIIVGMALNILAAGTIPVLCKFLFNSSGQTPSLALEERIPGTGLFIVTALLLSFLIYIFFKKTVLGLRIIVAGDSPRALRAQGVDGDKVRFISILLGSVLVGLGGIYLSLGAGSGYTRNMSAGRGFIALTALILGSWRPIPTFLACVFFGLLDALQIFLQNGAYFQIPTQFIQSLPYVITLLLLAGWSSRSSAPKALNK